MSQPAELLRILDLARWAPSGDNTQPWRFEILADDHVVVHAFDTRDDCVYDLDGRASQLSVGALLETVRLAASAFGLTCSVRRRAMSPERRPEFDVRFVPNPAQNEHPLAGAIKGRSVQRRPLSTRRIRDDEKSCLHGHLPPGYEIIWLETGSARQRVARILFTSAGIRLTTREAFETHRRVIEWNARWSDDKIPDQAIGLDPLTRRLTKWVMQDWRRAEFMNRYLGGTLVPRIELDLIPALACGAHVFILAPRPPGAIDDFIDAGAAVQRFWLAAHVLGLQHQPQMTPLIFARYAAEGRRFANSQASAVAARVRAAVADLIGAAALEKAVWFGRLGAGAPASSRSRRLPLESLLLKPS